MLPPLPVSSARLERYRLQCRRWRRAGLAGSHPTRRKGQSLEFRDLVAYVPGDDIRHIDWVASARTGARREWLVRNFQAEEQLTLAISIDTRASMRLPEGLPKGRLAGWLAEAVARVVLQARGTNDRVLLHRLFGPAANSVFTLTGAPAIRRIRPALQRLLAEDGEAGALDRLNVGSVRPGLPPAAVWLIITDGYFADAAGQALAREIMAAQDGWRRVILVDLDSWAYEAGMLRRDKAGLLRGPGRAEQPFDERALGLTERRIAEHKQGWLRLIQRTRADMIWAWPAYPVAAPGPAWGEDFFQTQFFEDVVLQRLFRGEA